MAFARKKNLANLLRLNLYLSCYHPFAKEKLYTQQYAEVRNKKLPLHGREKRILYLN